MPKQLGLNELQAAARDIRVQMLKALNAAGSGHTGGPMGIADVLAVLYFHEMQIDPRRPDDTDRDRFVLSAAHMVPVLYATLAQRGFFPIAELSTLRQTDSRLKGHTFRDLTIGVETTGGSLGQGINVALGFALASKLRHKQSVQSGQMGQSGEREFRTYCVIGDGESNEGSIWEAAMFAAKYKLNNLCVICDRNGIQLSDDSNVVMPLDSLADKWRAFNWNVIEIDGNDLAQIMFALNKAKIVMDKPTIIIASTVPGKGVSFMERNWEWHGKVPNDQEVEQAITELGNKNNE